MRSNFCKALLMRDLLVKELLLPIKIKFLFHNIKLLARIIEKIFIINVNDKIYTQEKSFVAH